MKGTDKLYDVIVLGAGISGTVLAAILARHGARVVVIDSGTHPRFAVGESTVPATSRMYALMADRYDVPELLALSDFDHTKRLVGPSSGRKKHIGFVYHRPGMEPRANEAHQLALPGFLGWESHLYRQDTDQYMCNVALHYGCDIRMNTTFQDFRFLDEEVQLLGRGELFRGKCLVDATGYASPIAQKLGLRAKDRTIRHDARTLFTHMADVAPYDACVTPPDKHGNSVPWVDGTVHHVFSGGWAWVIPFNNHEDAVNPLCSVGVTVNRDLYPFAPDGDPEQDFLDIIQQFPAMARQFRDAKAARPWVRTNRFQYSSTETVRDRYVMMSHSAGFIDPLFSRGLCNTVEVINMTAWRLLEAIDDGDFSAERFRPVDELQRLLVQGNDELIASCYTGFRDFDLWDCWLRIWAMGQIFGELRVFAHHLQYKLDRDPEVFKSMEQVPYPGKLFPTHEPYARLWDRAVEATDDVRQGKRTAEEVVRELRPLLLASNYGPPFMGLGDPNYRNMRWARRSILSALKWYATTESRDLKEFHTHGFGLIMRRMGQQILHGHLDLGM